MRRHRGERGELADRVADDDVGLEPLGADRGQDGEARRDERRLLHLGLDELLERRVEAELLQIEARCLAADPVDLHRLGHRLGELAAHPGLERTLAGETESNFAHSILLELSLTVAAVARIVTGLRLPIRSTPSPR